MATALRYGAVQEGLKVVLADIEEAALRRTAAELQDAGAQVLTVVTDVSKARAAHRWQSSVATGNSNDGAA